MENVPNPLIVWKHAGETLDQLLDRVRLEYEISKETKITYAGRLDPLAGGIMILLVGDGVHDKELYNKLDKRYRATVVLGFETDTYDVLGIVQSVKDTSPVSCETFEQALEKQIGKQVQNYPPYSSKNINGVPLWKLARDGNLPDVLPSREIVVHDAKITGDVAVVSAEVLHKQIQEIVSRVQGDFRQEEILIGWEKNIVSRETYQILEIDYHVGSGTYIRGLVHELGQQLGSGAVLLELERYQVGKYQKSDIL
jgi:tRNA pseudouridine55 synthase